MGSVIDPSCSRCGKIVELMFFVFCLFKSVSVFQVILRFVICQGKTYYLEITYHKCLHLLLILFLSFVFLPDRTKLQFL